MRAPRSRDRLDALRSELKSIVFANVFDVKAFAEYRAGTLAGTRRAA